MPGAASASMTGGADDYEGATTATAATASTKVLAPRFHGDTCRCCCHCGCCGIHSTPWRGSYVRYVCLMLTDEHGMCGSHCACDARCTQARRVPRARKAAVKKEVLSEEESEQDEDAHNGGSNDEVGGYCAVRR